MSFKDWLFSTYPNPSVNGRWGILHILVLVFCIITIITLGFIFKNKSQKSKKIVMATLMALILLFELTRRSINLFKTDDYSFLNILNILLPRPWCAISCWSLMFAFLIQKRFAYNFASMSALLCSAIFFAYPGVGFNNKYMLFENIYSICTHALLLISSILFMVLGFTKFDFKTCWQDSLYYLFTLCYTFLEIFVLKIEDDPMYFMPGNDIQNILGLGNTLYIILYFLFVIFYFSLFYTFTYFSKRKSIKQAKN